jgi:hypothetical protein
MFAPPSLSSSFGIQLHCIHPLSKVSGRSGPKSIRPHLKLNTFELKYTSVYHFKMFLIDLILKIQTLEFVVCNQEINVLVIFDCTLN